MCLASGVCVLTCTLCNWQNENEREKIEKTSSKLFGKFPNFSHISLARVWGWPQFLVNHRKVKTTWIRYLTFSLNASCRTENNEKAVIEFNKNETRLTEIFNSMKQSIFAQLIRPQSILLLAKNFESFSVNCFQSRNGKSCWLMK